MTAARRSHEDESSHPSQIGAPGRSAGRANRADPVFHPSNDDLTQSNEPPSNPERFGSVHVIQTSESRCSNALRIPMKPIV